MIEHEFTSTEYNGPPSPPITFESIKKASAELKDIVWKQKVDDWTLAKQVGCHVETDLLRGTIKVFPNIPPSIGFFFRK